MRTWTLGTLPVETYQVSAALASVVATIGTPEFGETLLTQLNGVLPVGCWSAYEIGHSNPRMYLSGTYQRKDTTLSSWRAYLSGPHLSDRTLLFSEKQSSRPTVCHVTAEEIPSMAHREMVYRQFGMTERLSIVERPNREGAVFAVNLYRYQDQRHFSDREMVVFELMAQPLLAAVRRHVALLSAPKPAPIAWPSIDDLRKSLKKRQADLSNRELDVCARVITGMTYDGIAADLGLMVPTVKTYRNRAFERLGIHFRSELVNYYLEESRSKGRFELDDIP